MNAGRRKAFLDMLAATCCVDDAITAAESNRASLYALRRRDPAFAEEWAEALTIGYERVEAKIVDYVLTRGADADRDEAATGDGDDDGGVAAPGDVDAVADVGSAGSDADGKSADGDVGNGAAGDEARGATVKRIGAGQGQGQIQGEPRRGSGRWHRQPGAGLPPSDVPAWVQVAMLLLNRHRASVTGGKPIMRGRVATAAETDAVLTRRLDQLARSMRDKA